MAAMTSFHAAVLHLDLVNEHAACSRRLCSSVCQFLIYLIYSACFTYLQRPELTVSWNCAVDNMAVFGRIIVLLCNSSSGDNGSIYFRISQSARRLDL